MSIRRSPGAGEKGNEVKVALCVNTKEAAEILGLNQRSLHRLVNERKLPAEKRNGVWLIPRDAVLREKERRLGVEKKVEKNEIENAETEGLRRTNRRLLVQLADAKAKKTELVRAVYDSARDAHGLVRLPPVPPLPKSGGKGTPEVAVAVLSDWQLAKVTPTYNTEVCEKRIAKYAATVRALAKLQRADHPVRECHVYLLGDLVEGELIFPGQAHRIDASLFRQVSSDGPRILGGFLRRMLAEFDQVHVEGVIGNHGRLGGFASRDYHPESNADAMMYEITRIALRDEPRLTWGPNVIAGERRWYAVDKIGEKSYLLFHGDQIRGHSGFPWYGFGKKIMGWRMGAIPEPFDYALCGHFHTPARLLCGNIAVWASGSTESDNTYAQEQLAATGTPSQWLLFAHPRRGITAEYLCHLQEAK